jgi:hypothetical protein
MGLNAQQRVGRYEVIREIGRSNDIIYEAWDPSFDRRVAIKLLTIPTGIDPQFRADRIARFKREAQALGALSHQNIMQVYDCGDIAGSSYLVMELVDGQSLQSYLNANGFLGVPRVQELLSQALAALQYCHSKGVVHRDLKPANMQISGDGSLKLLDFGLARMDWQAKLTQTGSVFGTLHYMSPEQCCGKQVDARSDLFSIGIMAFEMFTGCLPFDGNSQPAVLHAIVYEEPQYPGGIDPRIRSFLEKALKKDVAQRFQTAAEMLSALDSLGPSPAKKATPRPPNIGPTPRATPTQVNPARPSPDSHSAALVGSMLGSIALFALGAMLPAWRTSIILTCFALAAAAFRYRDLRRAMAAPFAAMGIALIIWGMPMRGGSPAATRGAYTGTGKATIVAPRNLARKAQPGPPSTQNATATSGRKPGSSSNRQTMQLPARPRTRSTVSNQSIKNVPKKRDGDAARPSLRGNSRLGSGNGSEQQGGQDTSPGLRSGSRLGSGDE